MTHFVAKGLIRRVHGVGSFVAPGLSLMRMVAPAPASAYELCEAQLLLQPDIAALAAQRATQVHIDLLARSLACMVDSLDHEQGFHAAYHQFHQTLLEATCNPLMCMLLRWGNPEASCDCLPCSGDRLRLLDIHRNLYGAVRAGKAELAKVLLQSLASGSDAVVRAEDGPKAVTMRPPASRRSKAPRVDWPLVSYAGRRRCQSMQ